MNAVPPRSPRFPSARALTSSLAPGLALALAAPLAGGGTPAGEPEWGGYRGARGDGVAAGCALPDALDPERNLLWRRELAGGYSSPVVAGDYLFLTAAEGDSLLTICLLTETGEEEWIAKTPYDGAQRIGQNSPAAPTPVTDGESVFALFHHAGLLAYDMDGRELWRNDLDAPFMIPHGLSSSPVLHDGRVVVQIDQDGGSRLVCVDAESGETLWDVPRSVNHGYATPAILAPEEGPTQVIANGGLRITSYDLASGEELWWVQGAAWQVKCVPVIHEGTVMVNAFMASSSEMGAPAMDQSFDQLVAERDADGDGTISLDEWDIDFLKMAFPIFDLNKDEELDAGDYAYLVTAGREVGGLFAIRPDGRGDVTDSHVTWLYDKRRGLSDVLAPVVVGDTLFQLRDGGVLTAIDVASGEVIKQERVGSPDAYFASPVAAGDRLLLASREGLLTVVSAGRDFEELSSNDLEEQVWSVPALTSERVFVRSQEALYCFGTALAAEPEAGAEASTEGSGESDEG